MPFNQAHQTAGILRLPDELLEQIGSFLVPEPHDCFACYVTAPRDAFAESQFQRFFTGWKDRASAVRATCRKLSQILVLKKALFHTFCFHSTAQSFERLQRIAEDSSTAPLVEKLTLSPYPFVSALSLKEYRDCLIEQAEEHHISRLRAVGYQRFEVDDLLDGFLEKHFPWTDVEVTKGRKALRELQGMTDKLLNAKASTLLHLTHALTGLRNLVALGLHDQDDFTFTNQCILKPIDHSGMDLSAMLQKFWGKTLLDSSSVSRYLDEPNATYLKWIALFRDAYWATRIAPREVSLGLLHSIMHTTPGTLIRLDPSVITHLTVASFGKTMCMVFGGVSDVSPGRSPLYGFVNLRVLRIHSIARWIYDDEDNDDLTLPHLRELHFKDVWLNSEDFTQFATRRLPTLEQIHLSELTIHNTSSSDSSTWWYDVFSVMRAKQISLWMRNISISNSEGATVKFFDESESASIREQLAAYLRNEITWTKELTEYFGRLPRSNAQ